MCRFTQGQCTLDCLSVNITNYESYALAAKNSKQQKNPLRILPTIDELQEEEKENKVVGSKGEKHHHHSVGGETNQSNTSSYCLLSSAKRFENLVKGKKDVFKKEERWISQTKVGTATTKITGHKMSKPSPKDFASFKGFGDFFPQDFLTDLNENETAEVGVKRYLEKQRAELSKVNCREQQLKILHKNQGPEVQSWLHFFG